MVAKILFRRLVAHVKPIAEVILVSIALTVGAATFGATAIALPIGQGGSSFSCDVNTKTCTCTGVPEGADCTAMRKNCANTCTGGQCTIFKCALDHSSCECTMALKRVNPIIRAPTVNHAPSAQ